LRVSTNFLLKKYPELCAEFRKVNEKVKEVDGILIKKVGKKLKEGNLKIKVFKDIQGRG
jgi:asparagine synthetase A